MNLTTLVAMAIIVPMASVQLDTQSAAAEASNRDKTGTNNGSENTAGPQVLALRAVRDCRSFLAEGMGFEPTTPCGASDFESDRWPIRLPSNDQAKSTPHSPTRQE